MPGLASCVRGDRVCVFGFGRVLVRGRNDGETGAAHADARRGRRRPRPQRTQGGGDTGREGSNGRGSRHRDTARQNRTSETVPRSKTPRPSARSRRSRDPRVPADRERREQDCVSEKQSERTWVLRLPARMARAGPAAPTAFAAVTRLAAAKPARRDRRRALIVDGARSEKCASTGLLTTPKHRCDRIIPKLPSG